MTDKNKTKNQKSPKRSAKKVEKQDNEEAQEKEQTQEEEKTHEEKEKTQEEEKEILPPLDFSSLVLPFFTQALIKLAEVDQGETKNQIGKLELVKRLIDLLDMLKSRTEGNLKSEELMFLDQCLHQLRMSYMEQAKIISL
jgi:hypothetical protein